MSEATESEINKRRDKAAPMQFEYELERTAPAVFNRNTSLSSLPTATATSSRISSTMDSSTITTTTTAAAAAAAVLPHDNSNRANIDTDNDKETRGRRAPHLAPSSSSRRSRSNSRTRVKVPGSSSGGPRSRRKKPAASYRRASSRSRATNNRKTGWFSGWPGLHMNRHEFNQALNWWTISRIIRIGLALFAVRMFYVAVETVRTDVQLKANERMAAIEESIRMCRANYENNICDDPNGRPLLADFCPGWKKCMEQDSSDFGRSRLVAEAAAEIIEAFMQPLSLRTILIFVLTAFGVLALLNIIYTIFTRNSNGHSSSTIAHPSSYPMLHPHPMHLEGPSGQKLRVQEVWHETEINHESYSDDDDDDDDDHEEHEDDYRHRHSSRHDQNPATMAMNRRRGRHRGRSSRSHSHSRSRSRSHSRTRTTIRYVNDNDY